MKKGGQLTACLLSFALLFCMFPNIKASAAKTASLSSKKITITEGSKKVLKVKNTTKKVTWKIVSGKSCISINEKGKKAVTITGKEAGTAKVQAKIGEKKLVCKVTVKDKETDNSTSSSTTKFSDSYLSSVYYSNLQKVELTGDYRKDVLAIAESQLGYCEGNYATQLDGSYAGYNNYTEYGWYLGSNGRPWCSEFAVWCARMAGVPKSVLGNSRSANVENFAAPYYTWVQTSYAGGTYTPQPGDLALFAWTGTSTTGNLSHTAIIYDVVQTEDTILLTVIHGNSNDQVGKTVYTINASEGTLSKGRLVYIVAPDYESASNTKV